MSLVLFAKLWNGNWTMESRMQNDLKLYPAYKDSGVPWLGQVPEQWRVDRPKWLFQKMDRPVRENDNIVTCFRDGTVTLRKNRRTNGFTTALKEIGYQGIRRGDLIIHAMDAFAGAVGVSDSDGKGSPVYSVCEALPNANAGYYAYIIREMARSQWILALATGIRERSTDFRYGDFACQSVPVPPLSEQAGIVQYLNHADRKVRHVIRARQQLIKLLTEQKQAIIQRAVTRSLNPNVRLKPSGVPWLGDVPEHWDVGRLKSALVRNDSGCWGSDFSASGSLVLRSNEQTVDGTWQIIAPARRLLSPKEQTESRLVEGDLVITKSSGSSKHIGKTSLVTPEIAAMGCCFSNFMQRIRLDATVEPRLAWYWLNSQVGRGQLVYESNTTTGLANLNGTIIGNLSFGFPPLPEQMTIVKYLDGATMNLDKAIDAARGHIDLLREYRTRLIADVVTGKLDVRDTAAQLPEESEEETEPLDEEPVAETSDLDAEESDGDHSEDESRDA
jgi:type I restriction enzyme S subunit